MFVINKQINASFDVFTALKIQVVNLCAVITYSEWCGGLPTFRRTLLPPSSPRRSPETYHITWLQVHNCTAYHPFFVLRLTETVLRTWLWFVARISLGKNMLWSVFKIYWFWGF